MSLFSAMCLRSSSELGVKSSLYILDRDDRVASQLDRYGYYIPDGSTITGIADSFLQFGWFGCVFFVLAGWFARSLFEAAEAGRSLYAQLLYILSSTTFMRSVIHQVADFLPGVLFFVIFLGLAACTPAAPKWPHFTRPAGAARQIGDGRGTVCLVQIPWSGKLRRLGQPTRFVIGASRGLRLQSAPRRDAARRSFLITLDLIIARGSRLSWMPGSC